MEDPAGYPIGYVSLATGLSTHALRAWERRYNAITPHRTESGRRLYSREHIDRLLLLKKAVAAGFRISTIAALDGDGLRRLIHPRPHHLPGGAVPHAQSELPEDADVHDTIDAGLAAVDRLDGEALRSVLQSAALGLNRQTVLEAVIRPLMDEVGARWADGRMRIVHGHLAANVVQACLERMLEAPQDAMAAGRPRLVIATPAGQWCYLGALAVAVTVQDHGWSPALVGANLPSEEIATACEILEPQMLALSITCRIDDAYMHNELMRLSRHLGDRIPFLAGGRAAERYRRSIEAGGGTFCGTTSQLLALLQ